MRMRAKRECELLTTAASSQNLSADEGSVRLLHLFGLLFVEIRRGRNIGSTLSDLVAEFLVGKGQPARVQLELLHKLKANMDNKTRSQRKSDRS
jgi:hypothetical protein